jgi:hypothetical protein
MKSFYDGSGVDDLIATRSGIRPAAASRRPPELAVLSNVARRRPVELLHEPDVENDENR